MPQGKRGTRRGLGAQQAHVADPTRGTAGLAEPGKEELLQG